MILSAVVPATSCGARTSLPGTRGEAFPPEVCNGIDDDRDGKVDDVPPIACGVGACRVEVPGCVDGKIPVCTPLSPSAEVCNGIDDDCNGAIDDGLGLGPIAGPFVVDKVPQGALGASLVATETGLLAVWSVGFNGSSPFPNLFSRALDADGKGLAPPAVVNQRTVPRGPRAAPSANQNVVVTYCGRYGADDRATSALTTASGQVAGPEVMRSPGDRGCSGADPDGAWTGRSHLFAITTNAPATTALEVLLDVADVDGTSVGFRAVVEDADVSAPARLAVGPNGAVLVAGTRRPNPGATLLAALGLDALGQSADGPVLVEPPPGSSWGATEVAPAASGGFVAIGLNRDGPGLIRARLASSGALIEPAAALEGVSLTGDVQTAFAARQGGGFVFVGNAIVGPDERAFVMTIDDAGHAVDTWMSTSAEEPWFFVPSVATRDGRIFVLYQIPMGADELRVTEFGCVP